MLGAMLYLDIKNGKEAKNASVFQQDIGGTEECMKRIMEATKGCGRLSFKNI